MTRTRIRLIPIMLVLLAKPAFAQDPMPGTAQDGAVQTVRPTMTVADFDTDRTGWMPPPRLGTTLAEMLTDRLVATGRYRMMDREWLLSAQDGHVPFPQLVERAAGAGVDYLVAGSVTRLSIENRSSTGGGVVPLPLIGALIHKHKTESVIGLTIRVIDVHTGEVVATSTAEKGATQQNSAGGGVVVIGPVPLFGAGGTSATGFHDRLLDTAVQEAVTAAADKIVAAASRLVRASK